MARIRTTVGFGLVLGRLAAFAPVLVIGAIGVSRPGVLDAQTSRDSAGIRIVENRAPSWTGATAWRFSPEPTLQIGAVEGDSSLQFNRTQYATQLSDGRIIVAQSSSLRVFSPAGAFLQTIGRRGRGPGEFGLGVSGIAALRGDTIAVNQSRSIVLFDSRGAYVRAPSTYPPNLLRDHRGEGGILLPDGSALLTVYEPEPREWKVGVIRPTRGYIRVTPGGIDADTAGFFPGLEQVVVTGGAQPDIDIRPFGPRTDVAAGGDRVYIGDNASYEVRGYTLDGLRPRVVIRRSVPAVPVTAADKAAWVQRRRAMVASIPPVRRAAEEPLLERMIARAEFPRTHPPYTQIVADRLGNLWVRETPPRASDAPTFAVYDRTGRLLGNVSPPTGVTILEIGADYMLGVWKNEDDVEFIRRYTLTKP